MGDFKNTLTCIALMFYIKHKTYEKCAREELERCGILGLACCQWTELGHVNCLGKPWRGMWAWLWMGSCDVIALYLKARNGCGRCRLSLSVSGATSQMQESDHL